MFQRFFLAAMAAVASGVAYVRRRIKRWGWRKTGIGAGVIVVALIILNFIGGGSETPVATNDARSVMLASVADLSNEASGLSVGGTVSSKSEATVRAEKSGEVTSLNYELGDNVGAGAIVAQIENASERAAVLQAQAGVEAAQASSGISGSSALGTLLSAYAAIQNTLKNVADPMFINPDSTPHTYFLRVHTAASAAKRDAENMRGQLNVVLERQNNVSSLLSGSGDLSGELAVTESELRETLSFLDALIAALNEGDTDETITAAVLEEYKDDAIAARATLTSSLTAVSSAKQSVQNNSATSASSAAIKQAQAALAFARANLEHTIIRAPISGTINSFSLKLGDFAQSGNAVLTVANNNALEIVAFVTETDARELSVGSKATLSGGIEGVITRIAPAIDPVTKKIEVRIGITGSVSALVNGQSVTVELAHTQTPEATTQAPTRFVIPLSALKIGVDDMVVYTVDENSTLVSHSVELGTLLGDRVEITKGLTADMRIVVDARGLRPGETVIVK